MKSQPRKALWLVKGIRRKIALELHSGGHDAVEYCRPNGVVETTVVRPNRQRPVVRCAFLQGGTDVRKSKHNRRSNQNAARGSFDQSCWQSI